MPPMKRSASSEPSPHLHSATLPDSAPAPNAPVPRTRLKRARIVKDEDSEVIMSPRTRTRSKRTVSSIPSTSSLKLEDAELEGRSLVNAPEAKAPKRQKASSKPKPIKQSLEVAHPAPENWRTTYDTIKQMRARIIAPVDTMGCDQAQHEEKDPQVSPLLCRSQFPCTYLLVPESSVCDPNLTHAFVANQRRGDGRCCQEPSPSGGWCPYCREYSSGGGQCDLWRNSESGILAEENAVRSLCSFALRVNAYVCILLVKDTSSKPRSV